jgi:4-amino-4-deoxychorismate synthase (2-amino-4-deoxychorismate-forming) component I
VPLITAVPVSGATLRTLAATQPLRYPVFFDSAAEGPLAQYSVLAAKPRAALFRNATGQLHGDGYTPVAGGFFDNLEAWYRTDAEKGEANPARKPLPFLGGWFVYLGYEVAAEIEPQVQFPVADLPHSAFALRVDNIIVHELATGTVYAVSQNGDAEEHARLIADLAQADEHPFVPSPDPPSLASLEEEPADLFLAHVRAAQEHIAAGDIYQANLSRRWRLELCDGEHSSQVYAALRRANPAPFAASVQLPGMTLFSSSPERLMRIEDRDISTRPIAGTRARQGTAEQDRQDTAELVAHPKERAEHIMLIDLERNDLGRVCEAGSVTVDEYMVTESYAHVHHIVSNVRGRLRADRSPVDALRALFPGGTITGCPKVRCMQIIAALEGEGRGAYTGSLGWLGTDGDADFNILIRTLTLRGKLIELRAGAGIVADSIPEHELEETRAKARGLLRAFGVPH